MATVLVIGGTGLIGRPTVHQLIAVGHTVYSLSRSGKSVAGEQGLAADLSSSDWMKALSQISGAVDVLVYSTFSTSADIAYDHRINVKGMEEAFEQLNPAKIIYVSSVGVFGSNLSSGNYSEDSPRVGDSIYARDKIEAAEYLKSKSSKNSATILFLSNVYDERSSRVQYYRGLLSQGYFIYKRDGKGIYNVVHAADVANAIVLSISSAPSTHFAEYVVNGEHLEFRKWVSLIEAKFDLIRRPKLPQGLERIVRGPIRKAISKLGVRSPMRIPEPKATTYEAKIVYRSDKITRELGWIATRHARDVLKSASSRVNRP